jgi:hypothetical protein
MEVIITDDRHKDIRILHEETVARRRFRNWTFSHLPAGAPSGGETQVASEMILALTRRLKA